MSRKHHDEREREPFVRRSSPREDRVITEFSYVAEGGKWVDVPVGEIPSGIPDAHLRYARHMGWISTAAAEEPVTLPDAPEEKEVTDVPTIFG